MRFFRRSGFTLVEMLVVIVIIGILVTALIPRLTGIRDRAKYVAADTAIKDIKSAIFLAQVDTNLTLTEITNHHRSFHACRSDDGYYLDMNLLSDSSSECSLQWRRVLRSIESAASMLSGTLGKYDTDPRGHPYVLDENEGEYSDTDCRYDRLWLIGNAKEDRISFYYGRPLSDGVKIYDIPGLACNSY